MARSSKTFEFFEDDFTKESTWKILLKALEFSHEDSKRISSVRITIEKAETDGVQPPKTIIY